MTVVIADPPKTAPTLLVSFLDIISLKFTLTLVFKLEDAIDNKIIKMLPFSQLILGGDVKIGQS